MTNNEIVIEQRKRLYDYLMLEKENEGQVVKGLSKRIRAIKAEMQQEDVAWVEKMASEED